jgi:hypothetical protein
VKKEDDETRIRVVHGDSILGLVADQDGSVSTDHIEPTSPQRSWAIKTISEMDRLWVLEPLHPVIRKLWAWWMRQEFISRAVHIIGPKIRELLLLKLELYLTSLMNSDDAAQVHRWKVEEKHGMNGK